MVFMEGAMVFIEGCAWVCIGSAAAVCGFRVQSNDDDDFGAPKGGISGMWRRGLPFSLVTSGTVFTVCVLSGAAATKRHIVMGVTTGVMAAAGYILERFYQRHAF
eukprot:TRINITY_DN94001_c0_g1_i1.p2 TRINITY_DN94001_c0_g1~~TRINITY_DN94001_c0_g1_i1.p2  ORF type:complete len:105 (-),score=16.59 TRINITY_DN94001_c0_g1_i1:237-551(-)